MTTSKARLTVYLCHPSELDDLREALRILAPLTDRGRITGSTCVEAAVSVALRDVHENGAQSAIFQAMVKPLVTLPVVKEAQP